MSINVYICNSKVIQVCNAWGVTPEGQSSLSDLLRCCRAHRVLFFEKSDNAAPNTRLLHTFVVFYQLKQFSLCLFGRTICKLKA
ncbi:unnamed protein product [Rodentolepis nana]|uniref:Uncharacterized protein n=1 Tax=Rodentolepis nana TaxID=102285 RepID=A0A0R3TTZ2_RODNA|nr:unnamed protein product [Rodentolepis nana]VDO09790.1 unnamed protein product [Rodentolepis nana]